MSRFFSSVLERAQREAAGLDPADQREGERAVGLDGELAGEVGLVVRGDRQHVLRADDVVGDGRRGALREDGGGHRERERSLERRARGARSGCRAYDSG